MKDYEAYLFDWDGTLACTAEIWLEEIKRQLHVEGIRVSDADNARHLGDFFGWFEELGLPKEQANASAEQVIHATKQRLPDVFLYGATAHMLAELHSRGKKIALITSTGHESLALVMDRYNIRHLFDIIVTGDDVAHIKPDPEGIFLALDKLRVRPSQAVMLGDTHNDILAAHNAGIHSALFYPDTHKLIYDFEELQSHHPTHTIHHWQELLDQLG